MEESAASAYKAPTAQKALLAGMGAKPSAKWASGAQKGANLQLQKAMAAVPSALLKCMGRSRLSLMTLW